MFKDSNIWNTISNGSLSTKRLSGVPSVTYRNCTSRILLHFDSEGNLVASTHRIMNENTGRILHWDAKGIQAGDTRYERGDHWAEMRFVSVLAFVEPRLLPDLAFPALDGCKDPS